MKLTDIILDDALQNREKIDQEVINEYTEVLREGGKLPAVTVYHDGSSYYLADGWHRYHAHKEAGLAEIEVDVVEGSYRKAWLYSLGANEGHGLRRSNLDKYKAVDKALEDMELETAPDREIARICRVSHVFVANYRRKLNGVPAVATPRPKEVLPELLEIKEDDLDENHQLQELATEFQALAEENETLKAKLAVGAMEGTDEERESAGLLLENLQTTVKAQESEIVHYKARVHSLMNENNELKKQIKTLDKQIFAMRKQLGQ